MRTYKLCVTIEMWDTEEADRTTIIEERDFECADHEEAQELLAAAENAVNATPLDSS